MPGGGATDHSQPVDAVNPQGAGVALILCEHASNHIPERYKNLGLDPEVLDSHVAWDPGAMAVAKHLSSAMDAPLVASRVSRLVYDCNRPPDVPAAMPERSEKFNIPGNRNLSQPAIEERIATVYRPFCNAVTQVAAARKAAGMPTALITVHSFTPIYFDRPRATEIGILHDSDSRLADAMLKNAPLLPHRKIERNEPYGPADGVTHSLQIHGQSHGFANVMLELRNDLLVSAADQERMAAEVLTMLLPALEEIIPQGVGRA